MKQTRSGSTSALALAVAFLLAACDNNADENGAPAGGETPPAGLNQPEPAPAPAPEPALAPAPDGDAAATEGGQVYAAAGCAGCHGDNGDGDVGPALAGNSNLNNTTLVLAQILQGGEAMPPFGDRLSDEEVAAVANYIRATWGNTAPEMIVPADVAAGRGAGP